MCFSRHIKYITTYMYNNDICVNQWWHRSNTNSYCVPGVVRGDVTRTERSWEVPVVLPTSRGRQLAQCRTEDVYTALRMADRGYSAFRPGDLFTGMIHTLHLLIPYCVWICVERFTGSGFQSRIWINGHVDGLSWYWNMVLFDSFNVDMPLMLIENSYKFVAEYWWEDQI